MANGDSFGAFAQPNPVQVNPNPSPEDKKRLTSEWTDFLSNPETQAALMQFAISVTQPRGPGQSTLGQITGAVGAGGAAAGRVAKTEATAEQTRIENERAKQETDIRREGVAVRREAVGVQREGLAVEREGITSRERTAGADRDARSELAKDRLAANLGIAKAELDSRLFEAILKQQLVIDPLQFTGTPQERAAQMAAANAAQDADFLRKYQDAQGLLRMIGDPSRVSDRILIAAINQGEGSVDKLVLLGVARDRIEKLRGRAAEEAATQAAAATAPDEAAAVPEAAPLATALQGAPAPESGGTIESQVQAGAQVAPVEQAQAQAVRTSLPARIELIPRDQLLELFRKDHLRAVLIEVYGEAAVADMRAQLRTQEPSIGLGEPFGG